MGDGTKSEYTEQDRHDDEVQRLEQKIANLEREREAIRVAMGGYEDSNLVSLATTLSAREQRCCELEEEIAAIHDVFRDREVTVNTQTVKEAQVYFIAATSVMDFDRDQLGKIVRDAWIEWAKEQPDPKPSWLLPWEDLAEPDKEADRRIGEAVVRACEPGAIRPLAYLAVPYSDPSPAVREMRFIEVNRVAAKLMREGVHLFSPISHCHQIIKDNDLPQGWEFWERYDRAILACCHKLYVLMLDGWQESVGVSAEIKIAEEMGIPIEYVHREED